MDNYRVRTRYAKAKNMDLMPLVFHHRALADSPAHSQVALPEERRIASDATKPPSIFDAFCRLVDFRSIIAHGKRTIPTDLRLAFLEVGAAVRQATVQRATDLRLPHGRQLELRLKQHAER